MKIFGICIILFVSLSIHAQVDSVWSKAPEIKIGAFVDAFYVYDLGQPKGNSRQPFFYNHNRHNDFSINLGLVKAELNHEKYSANLGIQVGTYVTDNYASEPNALKNIHEANVGMSISKKNRVWIHAGVMPSYIGFESAVSIDNPTLTRSLIAENSPYFISGAKVIFKPNPKWELSGLLMNGWQRIQRLPGNSLPAFGTQVLFKSSDKVSLNWSTFVGSAFPDSIRRMRYFNNLYAQFQVKERFNFTVGMDVGLEQQAHYSESYDSWLGLDAIGRMKLNDKWNVALRGEYYFDEKSVIIPAINSNGFSTLASSINLDFSPVEKLMWRVEARWLSSRYKIYTKNNVPTYDNVFFSTSLAVKIG